MRIPRYITEYVAALSERDCRHQYARLLTKRNAERGKETIERWTCGSRWRRLTCSLARDHLGSHCAQTSSGTYTWTSGLISSKGCLDFGDAS